MDSELNVLQRVVVEEADLLSGIEENSLSGRTLLSHIVATLPCAAYSDTELKQLESFLAATKRKTDLECKDAADASIGAQVQVSSVLKLQSRNFGYDFLLVKSEVGKNWLHQIKTQVTLYRSNRGADRYSAIDTFNTLSKALQEIEASYLKAAALHLA